jgi:hypothetical protein
MSIKLEGRWETELLSWQRYRYIWGTARPLITLHSSHPDTSSILCLILGLDNVINTLTGFCFPIKVYVFPVAKFKLNWSWLKCSLNHLLLSIQMEIWSPAFQFGQYYSKKKSVVSQESSAATIHILHGKTLLKLTNLSRSIWCCYQPSFHDHHQNSLSSPSPLHLSIFCLLSHRPEAIIIRTHNVDESLQLPLFEKYWRTF